MRFAVLGEGRAFDDQGPGRGIWTRQSIEFPDSDGDTVLSRTIERSVVPRMLLRARRDARRAPAKAVPATPCDDDVLRLTDLIMREDTAGALASLERAHAAGLTIDGVHLGLVAPVALRLGDLWSDDRADLTQVTVGLACLRRVFRDFRPHDAPLVAPTGERVLIVPVPGDQHSFGSIMVGDFFRRSGWDTDSLIADSGAELARMVGRSRYAIIGFSLATERFLTELQRAIRSVRRASRNPNIGVMVGGPVFIADPSLVSQVGADSTAMDGRGAVEEAAKLLAVLRTNA